MLANPEIRRPRAQSGAPAATVVHDDLRRRITALDLKPGALLSRADLAADYGVSQTPVRDALLRLEADGLVDIFPQSKTVVSRIDLTRLYEAHFLRVAVECETVRRLTARPDAEALARARSIVVMQKAIMSDLDQKDAFNELDERFHLTLFQAVGQENLYHLVRSRAGQLDRARKLDLPRLEKTRTIVEAHTAILDGVASGEPGRAEAAVRAHLSGTVERIPALRAENPEYFQD